MIQNGYSYFINECLQYGTAMITTDFDSAYESVVDGENGYILKMDLSNLDINKIVNKIPKNFEYTPKTTVESWTSLLGNAEKRDRKVVKIVLKVEITREYFDTELKKLVTANQILEVTEERAKKLVNAKVGKILEVKRVEIPVEKVENVEKPKQKVTKKPINKKKVK